MPEAPWGRHTRWLTCLTIDADASGATREEVRLALEASNIEARPVWKPMHTQFSVVSFQFSAARCQKSCLRRACACPAITPHGTKTWQVYDDGAPGKASECANWLATNTEVVVLLHHFVRRMPGPYIASLLAMTNESSSDRKLKTEN